MNNLLRCAAAAACCSLSGCLYSDIRAPHAYRSAAPSEVKSAAADPTAEGRSCNMELLFLVAWGKGGYIDAVQKALKDHPDSILYDVKTDMKIRSVLFGLYAQTCTIVTGRVGKL